MKIPLNIVMTYPVHWSLYKVFRDFIQNFYDSVGYKNFFEKFRFEYENRKLTIWIEDKTFNYEWLLHIGASTKTFDFDSKGAVFCTYQMLGTNPFDLVVCLHSFKKEDREREALYSFDVIKIFTQIIENVDSLAAMKILEKMQYFWSSYPSKSIDIHTWYFVIQMLTEENMQLHTKRLTI